MPTNTGSRFWGRLADALIPGNAYNSTTGRWNPATLKTGIAGMVAGQFVPGGEQIVQQGAKRGMFGQGMVTQLRNEGIYNSLADQYGAYKREQGRVADSLNPGVQVPNASYTPSWSVRAPSLSAQPMSLSQMVAPQQALPEGVSGVQRQHIPVEQAELQVPNMRMAPGLRQGGMQHGPSLASYMTSAAARDARSLAAHERRGGGVAGFAHAHRDSPMPGHRLFQEDRRGGRA